MRKFNWFKNKTNHYTHDNHCEKFCAVNDVYKANHLMNKIITLNSSK